MYLPRTWDVPPIYMACTCARAAWRDPARRPARLPQTATYIRALTCAAPPRYIAGTSQVRAR